MSTALDLLTDACSGLTMNVRKMFGGHGFFAPNGGMFAGIVSDDEVIFKLADTTARAELISLGGHPWVYQGKHKPMTMSDWIVVPQDFYDDQDLFSAWAKRAHKLAPAKKAPAAKRRSTQAVKKTPAKTLAKKAAKKAVKKPAKAKKKK